MQTLSFLGLSVLLDPRMRAHRIEWQALGRLTFQELADEIFRLLGHLNSIARVRVDITTAAVHCCKKKKEKLIGDHAKQG